MDANGKTSKTGEISLTENKNWDVAVTISGEEKVLKNATSGGPGDAKPRSGSESPHRKSVDSYPENALFMPSPDRPPKIPNPETLTRKKTLSRSIYSKPKSRFSEQPFIDQDMFDGMPEQVGQTSNSSIRISNQASPRLADNTTSSPTGSPSKEMIRTVSMMASPGAGGAGGVDDDAEEIYKKVKTRKQLKLWEVKMKVLFQWVLLLSLVGCIAASLTVSKLKTCMVWDLELWKWFVLITVIISGLLITNYLMHFIVLLIELRFLWKLKLKVLHFVHRLRKSVQVCIWLIVVLVTWKCLFNDQHVERSKTATQVLHYVTSTIAALLVGAIMWPLKTLLVEILPNSFQARNLFDRIQESVFHQYVLRTLSGPPLMELLENDGASVSKSELSNQVKRKGKDAKTKRMIDLSEVHKMKRDKVSGWTLKMLVDMIKYDGLTTFSGDLEDAYFEGVESGESADREITNEMEAIAAAYHIFRNVSEPGCTYIDVYDLRRFMSKEEVDIVFLMIDTAETGQINRKTFTEWVVKAYKSHKVLTHALHETTAVDELNKLVTAILIVIVIVVWLLLTEIASTKVLVLLSSQFVVAAFIFGNTCKNVFEAIVFVFITHPFDVGDRCVIDGVQMIVEEINLLNTVFLRFDNEKIYYPNSVLSTKPISNFYRSPDMSDNVEFSIDFATPFEKINLLKDRITKYLYNHPQWYQSHNFVANEIEDMNKIKMAIFFDHTMNFQDYGEKKKRRSELIFELKKIFEELNVKLDILP